MSILADAFREMRKEGQKNNERKSSKFIGAFKADPKDLTIIPNLNNNNHIYGNMIDFDFSALYPTYLPWLMNSKYVKYIKRVNNRQKLYNKLKKLGRRIK